MATEIEKQELNSYMGPEFAYSSSAWALRGILSCNFNQTENSRKYKSILP